MPTAGGSRGGASAALQAAVTRASRTARGRARMAPPFAIRRWRLQGSPRPRSVPPLVAACDTPRMTQLPDVAQKPDASAPALPPWYLDLDALGVALLVLGTGAALLFVPDLSGEWLAPTSLAI